MRFLVEVRIPVEVGNAGLKDGSFIKQIQQYFADVKPEAAYFTVSCGQRTVYLVVDMASADKMVSIGEPLWIDWKADVTYRPVMLLDDLKKAMPDLKKIFKARK